MLVTFRGPDASCQKDAHGMQKRPSGRTVALDASPQHRLPHLHGGSSSPPCRLPPRCHPSALQLSVSGHLARRCRNPGGLGISAKSPHSRDHQDRGQGTRHLSSTDRRVCSLFYFACLVWGAGFLVSPWVCFEDERRKKEKTGVSEDGGV